MDTTPRGSEHTVWDRSVTRGCNDDREAEVAFQGPPGRRGLLLGGDTSPKRVEQRGQESAGKRKGERPVAPGVRGDKRDLGNHLKESGHGPQSISRVPSSRAAGGGRPSGPLGWEGGQGSQLRSPEEVSAS